MVFDDVGGDTWQQYTMHYASIVNHLRAGTFSLWDFTNGMGTNMFLLSLFDPSLILLYVIGVILGAAHMLFYLVWIQILKILKETDKKQNQSQDSTSKKICFRNKM